MGTPNLAYRVGRKFRRPYWVLHIVALMIAVLLWVTVMGGKRSEMTKKVNLEYLLPKNTVLATNAPTEVMVKLNGPRVFLKDIEDKLMTIQIDLSRRSIGPVDFVIREELLDLPIGLKVQYMSPSLLNLRIDRAAIKRVPLRAVIGANLPLGLRVASVSLRPSSVEIRGPLDSLRNIEALATEEISLSPHSMEQDLRVGVNLSDLPGVSVAESERIINVTAKLEGEMSSKRFTNLKIKVRSKKDKSIESVDAEAVGIKMRPSLFSVIVSGPRWAVESLRPEQIDVWVELPRLTKGSYNLDINVGLAPELRLLKKSAERVELIVPSL